MASESQRLKCLCWCGEGQCPHGESPPYFTLWADPDLPFSYAIYTDGSVGEWWVVV